ncbi:YwmB family TATA-box binding protein [Aureibacillus halotolerans]|uniref:TATA-box binding protein n=1 Tax=Aureibacillus halotolerans TaxID=1508390 RepID=A0A4R6U6R6_9BACI|nr:YwmB family TATA-box binding protein [Aureibacillus halotolerans]TDQ38724.1 TATA-box binding protein [Aureibacillus halotolerans]
MKLKIIACALIFAFCVLSYTAMGKGTSEDNISEAGQFLDTAQQMMVERGIRQSMWSLYTRTVDSERFDSIESLARIFTAFSWVKTPGLKNTWDAKRIDKQANVTEHIRFVKKNGQSVLSYRMTGDHFNQQALSVFVETKAMLFNENNDIFACLQGEVNDIIEGGLLEEVGSLLRSFNAVPIEMMNEQSFVAVSAYNELWSQQIETPKGPMNLQVALRENEAEQSVDVTIGTPILTVEY